MLSNSHPVVQAIMHISCVYNQIDLYLRTMFITESFNDCLSLVLDTDTLATG